MTLIGPHDGHQSHTTLFSLHAAPKEAHHQKQSFVETLVLKCEIKAAKTIVRSLPNPQTHRHVDTVSKARPSTLANSACYSVLKNVESMYVTHTKLRELQKANFKFILHEMK
jgi:hypothetical protein